MRGKILIKNQGGQRHKIKVRYLVVILGLVVAGASMQRVVQAAKCPEVRVVFVRGSGGDRWEDQNYLAYKEAIEPKLATTNIKYEFVDLDYPAVGIGDPKVLAGAYFGAGEAYEFGESVQAGIDNLAKMVNSMSCPNTKYAVGGYSQGAMVVSGALSRLNADKLIYAATFGDPKIYLPEGAGVIPAACKGENLSDYRMYVPDCQAYKGLLGAYEPYEPVNLVGKVGVWCNGRDIFCSSKHWNLTGIHDHTAYVADHLYEDASRVIFDKICKALKVENRISSPHDTAILIDSTGSMAEMIDQYKAEALRLAQETLAAGGRVALYDYRDLDDPYDLVEHCTFETCNLEVFMAELEEIGVDGGGDTPESLLSASFGVMKALEWKQGSTKSLVVLTDANFLAPDRDGMTFDEVVKLSKEIDPVNFYIVTTAEYGEYYQELAERTDGRVVTDFDELSLLTDYIMERYDSLPRVEEAEVVGELPVLAIKEVASDQEGVRVKFENTGTGAVVVLNDAVLGMTVEDEIVLSGLDALTANKMTLVPVSDELRGEPVEVELSSGLMEAGGGAGSVVITPRVPNAGRR